MQKIYIVRLTDDEREACLAIVKKLKGSNTKVRRANILLKADADGPNWKDQDIAATFFCTRQCVENLRKRLVSEGFAVALHGKKRTTPSAAKKLDGKQEAKVIALRLSDPPEGRNGWTLRLLAEKVVELEIAPEVSYQTIRRTLKKQNHKTKSAILGPKAITTLSAETKRRVCRENGGGARYLRASVEPEDTGHYDGRTAGATAGTPAKQCFKETRTPIAATRNHARRVDYEYERAAVANIFMFSDPLGCWRRTSVRERKTMIDWAREVRVLLEEDYPDAEKIVLVCDNFSLVFFGRIRWVRFTKRLNRGLPGYWRDDWKLFRHRSTAVGCSVVFCENRN